MKRFFLFVAHFASLLIVTLNAHASSVGSMSLEVFKNQDERYWEVSVTCVNSTESWSMQRPIDSDQWCTSLSPTQCGENKFSLSAQVCDKLLGDSAPKEANYTAQAANPTAPKPAVDTTQPDTERYELLREQMQIEQQRIQIQQLRLALQRKELQLKRQQLGN